MKHIKTFIQYENSLNEALRGSKGDWKIKKVKFDFINNLYKRANREGIVLLGAGGNKNEWIDGVTDMLIGEGIATDTASAADIFDGVYELESTGGRTDIVLFFAKDKVGKLDLGKMAMWRLRFGDASWISDYVVNYKEHFITEQAVINQVPGEIQVNPTLGSFLKDPRELPQAIEAVHEYLSTGANARMGSSIERYLKDQWDFDAFIEVVKSTTL